ncbi:hypothetical protein [Streptomyces sp. wa1071]|uniref:hypothetical protein n=1 Tax=Streptomyces TaxID=1883 RepID=UPI0035A12A04
MLVRADGEWPVIHQYLSCGELSANRIDSDDNALVLVHLPPADGRATGGTGEGHRAHRQVADVRLQTTWSRPSSPPVRIAARADELQALPPRPLSTLRPLRGTRPSRTWTKTSSPRPAPLPLRHHDRGQLRGAAAPLLGVVVVASEKEGRVLDFLLGGGGWLCSGRSIGLHKFRPDDARPSAGSSTPGGRRGGRPPGSAC